MVNTPDDPRPTALQDLSVQQLTSLLRRASNQIEMLMYANEPHHSDDDERQRITAMSEVDRAALNREAVKTISDVRAEFRRRAAG
jgi:hypothetical protein